MQLFFNIWVKVFKNGASKICAKQPLKILKQHRQQTVLLQVFKRLSPTNFTCSILEQLDLCVVFVIKCDEVIAAFAFCLITKLSQPISGQCFHSIPPRKHQKIFGLRSSRQEVLLRKRCSENMQQIYRIKTCRSVISIKLQRNFIEITLRHGCSSVNLLHIIRTPFSY